MSTFRVGPITGIGSGRFWYSKPGSARLSISHSAIPSASERSVLDRNITGSRVLFRCFPTSAALDIMLIMTHPSRPCLLLDCYVEDRGASNFDGRLAPFEVETVHVPTEPVPRSAAGYSALVLTGSAASVHDASVWRDALLGIVRDAARLDVPVLGVCYGHQVVANALFGSQIVRQAAAAEIGWGEVRVVSEDPIFAGINRSFRTFLSHHDEVLAGPGRMRVLAVSDGCGVQAYRVGNRLIWGLQFHPEMGSAETECIVREKAEKHPVLGLDVDTLLAGAVDSSALGDRILANFVGLVSEFWCKT